MTSYGYRPTPDIVLKIKMKLYRAISILLFGVLQQLYCSAEVTPPNNFNSRVEPVVITPANSNILQAFCYISTKKAIEKNGIEHYPSLNGESLHGELKMKIMIRPDGELDRVVIQETSGSVELDQAAEHLVSISAPFMGCKVRDPSMNFSTWEITYRFNFQKEGNFFVNSGESLNSFAFLRLVDVTHFIPNYKKMAAVSAKSFAARGQGSDREYASFMDKVASSDLSDIRFCIGQAYMSASLSQTDANELVQLFQTPIGIKSIELSQQMLIEDIQRGLHKPFDPQLLTESERKELAHLSLLPVFVRYSQIVTGSNFQGAVRKCVLASKALRENGPH
jgi:hypothetical protein